MSLGTVTIWHREEGWGVIESADTPGGCFAHFSNIEAEGFRALNVGDLVEFEWEYPGFKQDGYDYRATRVLRRG